MTDLDRLRARLARLAGPADPVAGGARVLFDGGVPEAAMAMRLEIEETQLPRSLAFRTDRGDRIELCVKAGRIMAVTELSVAEGDAPGADGALSGGDPPEARALAAVIAAFLAGISRLTVETSRMAADLSPAVPGLSPAECFALPPPEGATTSPGPVVVLSGFESIAEAWIRVRGVEVVQSHGDAARLYDLAERELADREFAERELARDGAAHAGADGFPAEDICVILSGGGPDAETVISASLGGDLVFMVLATAHLSQALSHWREILARRTDATPG